MVYIYIATVVVMLGLIIFTSLAILTISKTTCQNIKRKTMELTSLYDYLLESSSQELKSKKQMIAQLEREVSMLQKAEEAPQEVEESFVSAASGAGVTMQTIENINKAQYQNAVLPQAYQEIRQNFDVQIEDVLQQIPQTAQEKQESLAEQLLALLPYETIYSMSYLPENEQLACLQESLPAEYQPMLERFVEETEAFCSLDFYTYLREIAQEESQNMIVYVSPNVAIKDASSLQVEVSDKICEGIQVEVNHVLYDFAIEKKEMGWVCQR